MNKVSTDTTSEYVLVAVVVDLNANKRSNVQLCHEYNGVFRLDASNVQNVRYIGAEWGFHSQFSLTHVLVYTVPSSNTILFRLALTVCIVTLRRYPANVFEKPYKRVALRAREPNLHYIQNQS